MGISISGMINSVNTKRHMSPSGGEPDWFLIPSAGKSSKPKAEFTDEIKELEVLLDYLEEKPSFDRKA